VTDARQAEETDTMHGWELREATGTDATALVALVQAAFEEHRGRLDPPSGAHDETAETIRQGLESARSVLAFAGEYAAGCVFYRPSEGHLYLFRLAVLPAYRRRGLGRALVEHVEGRARGLGLPRVRLGVRVALPLQRAYYERLGYGAVESASHPGYAEPTYVVMEKQLAAV
jgi:ribosomal protein S18 acetylase RimI-like enzyme